MLSYRFEDNDQEADVMKSLVTESEISFVVRKVLLRPREGDFPEKLIHPSTHDTNIY